jgi:CRISPR-associated protein Csm1
MNSYYKIALAGLLHDIGKFYQRAGKGKNQSYQEFKYQHALFTHQWFEDPEIKPSLSKAFNDIDEIKVLAAKHHNPEDSLESKVLQKADHLSSEEREKEKEDEFNLLHTVFERVSFIEDSKKEDDLEFWGYYRLKPLDFENLEDTIFPVIIQRTAKTGKLANPSDEKKIREEERKYPELYKQFLEDFKKINHFKEEQAFNFIYYLLQKYLWCVPASIYDKERGSRHYPDISLFDHSRVLSAIAVCLYDYKQENPDYDLNDKGEKNSKEKNIFLLYEAEIGGIQKFIYKVSKIDVEEKGFSVPKEFRGRSFFVSILPELLSRYILNKLDYPITNILYSGGGKFQLLLPNTNKVKNILKEFKDELSEYLHKEFHLDLSIVSGQTELSQEYLKGDKLREAITNLQISIDEDKKRKAKNLLTKDFEDGFHVCKSCKSLPRKEKEDICKWCNTFNELGAKLAKHEKLFIIYQFEDINKEPDLDFGKFGKVYLLDEPKPEIMTKAKEILNLNSTKLAEEGYTNGFKFIANIVPTLTYEVKDYLLKYADLEKKEREELENQPINSILPLNYIAEFAKGDKKLAVLRADVDNLGLIFSDGLRRYTISRIATLSRMLDLFFTGYISILINKVSEDYAKRELGNTNLKTKLIYTVYAGGDDLFLIGPYNLILDFVVELRKKFYKYTANNTDFGISGGIPIVGSKVSLEYMAKISEEMESISKSTIFTKNKQNYLKDAITIFEKSFKYSSEIKGYSTYNQRIFGNEELSKLYKKPSYDNYVNFETILNIANEIAKYMKRKDISRALAYRLLSLHRVYVSEDGKIDPVIYPKIFYQIGRNVKDGKVRNSLEEWLLRKGYSYGEDFISKENVIRNLDVILSIALMKTRGGKKDD